MEKIILPSKESIRKIERVIVHCSDTRASQDIGVEEIRRWHLDRGWSDIGYHFCIRRDGNIEAGRPVDRIGAHTSGHNKNSIGVCLIGGRKVFDYTKKQMQRLDDLVAQLLEAYDIFDVAGHRDFNPGKECPRFNVRQYFFGRPLA